MATKSNVTAANIIEVKGATAQSVVTLRIG